MSLNEGVQAHLVVQDMCARKYKEAPARKERKKTGRGMRLFADGKARVYTNGEVQNEIAAQRRIEEEEEKARSRRMKTREKKKAATEARDQAYKVMLEEYHVARSQWKLDNAELVKAKVPVKERPKLPKRPTKPPVADFEAMEEDEEDKEDEEENNGTDGCIVCAAQPDQHVTSSQARVKGTGV